jgi:hypothetical protein
MMTMMTLFPRLLNLDEDALTSGGLLITTSDTLIFLNNNRRAGDS